MGLYLHIASKKRRYQRLLSCFWRKESILKALYAKHQAFFIPTALNLVLYQTEELPCFGESWDISRLVMRLFLFAVVCPTRSLCQLPWSVQLFAPALAPCTASLLLPCWGKHKVWRMHGHWLQSVTNVHLAHFPFALCFQFRFQSFPDLIRGRTAVEVGGDCWWRRCGAAVCAFLSVLVTNHRDIRTRSQKCFEVRDDKCMVNSEFNSVVPETLELSDISRCASSR